MARREPEHLTPRYLTRFQCIGEACEENCCHGWKVPIDEPSYRRLQAAMKGSARNRARFGETYQRSPVGERTRGSFAVVKLTADATCSLLDGERLCSVQRKFGAEMLSDACATYPRSAALSGDRIEMTATVSCPEIARQVLLHEDALELVPLEPGMLPRGHFTNAVGAEPVDPYERYLDDVRVAVLSLLSRQRYPLAARFFFVAYFANRSRAFFKKGGEHFEEAELALLIADVARPEFLDRWYEHFVQMPTNEGLPIRLAVQLLDARLSDLPNNSFRNVIAEVLSAHAHTTTEPGGNPARMSLSPGSLLEMYHRRLDSLDELRSRFDQYLSNYAQNYWLREWYTRSSDLLAHTQALLVRIAILRLLILCHPRLELDAIASGAMRQALLDSIAVDVFYRFARGIEHSAPFLRVIQKKLEDDGLTGLAASVSLARF